MMTASMLTVFLLLSGSAPAAPEAPLPTLRFDFETGDLQGWQVVEGEFGKLVSDRKLFRNRAGVPVNKQGKFFLDTGGGRGDRETGVVESPVFTMLGATASMLVNGGSHADTYVALCTLKGKEVFKAHGNNEEVLERVTWDTSKLIGKQVFLRIVDRNRGGWGHIVFDEFLAHGALDADATHRRFAQRELEAARRELAAALEGADVQSLRQTVADLTDSFPESFAKDRNYAAELNRWEQRVQAARQQLESGGVAEMESARQSLARFEAFRREVLLANPLVSDHPILFVTRHQYKPDHHNTATLFQKGEINGSKFEGPGALKTLDVRTGKVTTLLEAPTGVIRDPEVHFSGQRIVFSMRRSADDDYHIYQINADGSGLKQLTSTPGVSDIDPLYLADDSLVFSSTREPKYCMCNRHIMANLFAMTSDGANVHQIGKSTLFEGHGSLTPDGRVLYDRWEYVDRNFGDAQGLWTVNPDGTNHALYWGNNTWSPGAVLDGRIIPDSEQAVCVFSSCHDRPWGALALIDPRRGLEGRKPVVRTWPASAIDLVVEDGASAGKSGYGFDSFKRVNPKYEDPYPLADPVTHAGAGKYFLCSRMTGNGEQMGLYLTDLFGNEVQLHVEEPGCFDPMPLAPRPRPAVVPSRRNFDKQPGYFYVHDVYQGTQMAGVQRGTVKYLRVVESPEKRFWTRPAWKGQGTIAPAMNWHDFNNKRILGTTPVEADGSAYFAVPADKFVYFQLLDAEGMMIQSMRSGTMVQSGERTGCVGCHDSRDTAPPVVPEEHCGVEQLRNVSVAGGGEVRLGLQREARQLTPWHGEPRLFSYMAEVQPVFDKYCVRCHDFGQPGAKKLVLAGDRDEVFNASYNELWRRGYVNVVGAGPSTMLPAKSWGSHASKLIEVLRAGHYKVKLDAESFDRLVTWIDLNAPYYPTYASAYPDNLAGRCPLDNRQLNRLAELTGVPLAKLASHSRKLGPQLSFDRPEVSPCLDSIRDDPKKLAEALSLIEAGQRQLTARPRGEIVTTFVACEVDQQRQDKYARRAEAEAENREAMRTGSQRFDDQQ